jgi:predicted transposase/invertase (TIGR01784 family)
MKTDILFYKLLEAQPSLLLTLAHLEHLRSVSYRFQSLELKEKAHRTDGVLFPETTASEDVPVIVCEVQFWADELIYSRLVNETAMLHLQMPEYKAFQMVLVLRSRSLDTDAGVWLPLRQSGAIQVIYLDELHTSLQPFSQQTPEEQAALLLINLTVTPENRTVDDALVPQLGSLIRAMESEPLRVLFRNLFVNLYASKYNHLTLDEVRAMIQMSEIFDDLHESLAVQQYAKEYAQQYAQEYGQQQHLQGKLEGKLESAIALLNTGMSVEQVAAILDLSIEAIAAHQQGKLP